MPLAGQEPRTRTVIRRSRSANGVADIDHEPRRLWIAAPLVKPVRLGPADAVDAAGRAADVAAVARDHRQAFGIGAAVRADHDVAFPLH